MTTRKNTFFLLGLRVVVMECASELSGELLRMMSLISRGKNMLFLISVYCQMQTQMMPSGRRDHPSP